MTPELQYLTWQRIAAQRQAQGNNAGAAEAYKQALAKNAGLDEYYGDPARACGPGAWRRAMRRKPSAQYDALRGDTTKGAFAAEMQYLAANALAQTANTIKATGVVTPTYPSGSAQALAGRGRCRYDLRVRALVDRGAAGCGRAGRRIPAGGRELCQRRLSTWRSPRSTACARPSRTAGGGLAWYYSGLSYIGLGQYDKGVQELDTFMSRWPNSSQWADAAMARARALARAGRTADAVAAYRELAKARARRGPGAQGAVAGGDLLLASSAADQAADAYLDLARRYPAADEGWRAYYAAGMTFFQKAEWRRAAEIWGEMAAAPKLAAFAAAGRLLLAGPGAPCGGRRRRREDRVGGRQGPGRELLRAAIRGLARWQARGVDARGRAEDRDAALESACRRKGRNRRLAAGVGRPGEPEPAGVGHLRRKLEAREGADGNRPRTEALLNWERVRKAHEKEPWTLAALAIAFRDAGANRLSLLSAEGVIGLRGQPLRETPVSLQKLAYPFPYEQLIRQEAAKQKLDPRLLAAIIRQESRFEPGVASSAGAQGLMQVMPGTAAGIAKQLAWPGYEDATPTGHM